MADQHMAGTEAKRPLINRDSLTLVVMAGFGIGLVGLAVAALPLYGLTNTTTDRELVTSVRFHNPKGVIGREMTTKFEIAAAPGLPVQAITAWPLTDRIGRVRTVTFEAINKTDHPVSTTTRFTVTPKAAAPYFNKIEDGCFASQTIAPGETVDMPVTFFVDPDIAKDERLKDLSEITLSYTLQAQ